MTCWLYNVKNIDDRRKIGNFIPMGERGRENSICKLGKFVISCLYHVLNKFSIQSKEHSPVFSAYDILRQLSCRWSLIRRLVSATQATPCFTLNLWHIAANRLASNPYWCVIHLLSHIQEGRFILHTMITNGALAPHKNHQWTKWRHLVLWSHLHVEFLP